MAAGASDPNVTDRDERTPLHLATHPEVVRFLVGAGANFHATDNGGLSPLQYAVRRNSLAAAEALIFAGADSDTRDPKGRTLLHLAVEPIHSREGTETVEALIRLGFQVDARDRAGNTPLHLATGSRHAGGSLEIMEALLSPSYFAASG